MSYKENDQNLNNYINNTTFSNYSGSYIENREN